MPSFAIQELLVKQERIRVEELARDSWKRHQVISASTGRSRRGLRRVVVMLAVATTMMTSVTAMSSSAAPEDADTLARNCVAHRGGVCRETPFPINRMPVV